MCKNQVYSSNTWRYLRKYPFHFCRSTNIMTGLKEQTEVYLSQYTSCNTLREHKNEAHVTLCYMHCIPASSNLPFKDFLGPRVLLLDFFPMNLSTVPLNLCELLASQTSLLYSKVTIVWKHLFFVLSFFLYSFVWCPLVLTVEGSAKNPEATYASNFQQMPYLPLSFALHLHHWVISFFDVI